MKLYRYRSFERGFDEIENSYLWFASTKSLNDVFDCDLAYRQNEDIGDARLTMLRLLKDEFDKDPVGTLQKMLADFPDEKGIIQTTWALAVETVNKIIQEMGLCCFSEIHDSLLMWAHYTSTTNFPSGTGLCIEYETENDPILGKAVSVHYTSQREVLSPTDVFSSRSRDLIVLRKSLEWSYEKEWRITIGAYMKEVTRKQSIEKKAITGIYCGPKVSREYLKKIQDLKKSRDLKFEIYSSRIAPDMYRICFDKLD
jgi:hypothetical protein